MKVLGILAGAIDRLMAKASRKVATPNISKGWGVRTPWTLLLGADPKKKKEMEQLLSIYQAPILTFYLAKGLKKEDAEDLTQVLLMDFFLVKGSHRQAVPAKGRFRNYLLAAASHAMADERKHRTAKRRGGSKALVSVDKLKEAEHAWEPSSSHTPEEAFDRQWALSTWRAAKALFQKRAERALVEAFDLFYDPRSKLSQQEAARKLGISVAAFNSRLYTARRQLFACLREIVRPTVESEDDLAAELAKMRDLLNDIGL